MNPVSDDVVAVAPVGVAPQRAPAAIAPAAVYIIYGLISPRKWPIPLVPSSGTLMRSVVAVGIGVRRGRAV
eukprot:2843841-Pyramimonas_sp.AAC.1